MTRVGSNVTYVLRRLVRRPGYVAASVACLAIGLAATALAYALLDLVLLRPPVHVRAPEQLVRLEPTLRIGNVAGVELPALAFPQFSALQESLQGRVDLGAYMAAPVTVGRGAGAVQTTAFVASHELVDLLGVTPQLGRVFSPSEDRVGGEPVVLISDELWNGLYQRSASAIGTSLIVDGHNYAITGILPAGFEGLDKQAVGIVLPLRQAAANFLRSDDALINRRYFSFRVVGRAQPTVASVVLADAATDAFRAQAVEGPELDAAARIRVSELLGERVPRLERLSDVSIWLLGLAVAILLLACINVAGLVVHETLTREREFRTRIAVGGRPFTVVHLVLLEGGVLSLMGTAIGLALAWLGGRLLYSRVLHELALPADLLSSRVVAAAVILAAGTVLASGITPSIALLRRISRSGSVSGARFARTGIATRAIPVVQIALTVILLVAVGQFAQTLRVLQHVPIGIDTDHLLGVRIPLKAFGDVPARADTFFRHAAERVAAIPGVEQVTVTSTVPFGVSTVAGLAVDAPGRLPTALGESAALIAGDAGIEKTLGLRVLRGRGLLDSDLKIGELVAVVSARMAEVYWPGHDPIGECLRVGGTGEPCRRIVGVVSDYLADPATAARPHLYIPLAQASEVPMRALVVRTAIPPSLVQRDVVRTLRSLSAELPVEVVQLESLYNRVLRPWRVAATGLLFLAGVAVIIAIVGVHTTVALDLARRRIDFGIRQAFGAPPSAILMDVLRRFLPLYVGGLILGVGGFLMMRAALIKLTTLAPEPALKMPVGVVLIFLVATAVASLMPLQRLLKSTPSQLLDSA